MTVAALIRTLLLTAGAVVALGATPAWAQLGRPNIVVIQMDDLDVGALETMVSAGLMPNLKSNIIDMGYDFRDSYAVGTFGATSRATFLTGRYPHNHGEIGAEPWLGEAPRFNQASTVATWLKTAGYTTALVGRYTTGYGYATSATYVPPGWDLWAGLVDPYTWSTSSYRLNINGTVIDFAPLNTPTLNYHQTDVLSWFSAIFIAQASAMLRPYFLVVTPVSYNREMWPGPDITNACPDPSVLYVGGNYWGVTQRPALRHAGTIFGNTTTFALPQTPSFNELDVSDKPAWVQNRPLLTAEDIDCRQKAYWRRLESMRAVDDLVGLLFAMLQATGTLNNTIVIFTSDNGFMDGQHRFPEKTPAFEESLRVPLYIRTRTSVGRLPIAGIALNTDLAPTIAHFAQATPTHLLDGRTLVTLMQNPAVPGWRKMGLFQHVRTDPASGPPNYFALRYKDAATSKKLVQYPTVTTGYAGELYDLLADPHELDSLYGDPAQAQEIQNLSEWITVLKTCTGLICTLLESGYTLPFSSSLPFVH